MPIGLPSRPHAGKVFWAFFLIFALLAAGRWQGFSSPLEVRLARGAVSLVQTTSNFTGGSGSGSVTATFGSTPAAGDLLVAVAGASNGALNTPTGWSVAIASVGSSPGQAIFYKIAGASEPAGVTVSQTGSAHMGLHIYEYRGIETNLTLDAVSSSTGSGASLSSGSLATSQPDELILAAFTQVSNGASFTWASPFNEENDFGNGNGPAGNRASYTGADRTVTSTGTFAASATSTLSGNWVGQIAAFRADIAFEQSAYRWFANADAAGVGAVLSGQNVAGTVSNAGDIARLRLLVHVSSSQLAASARSFKLQYVDRGSGTCAAPNGTNPSSYTDLATSTGPLRFADNASVADGIALIATSTDPTHSGHTVVNETYEEQNNFTNSQGAILPGQDGKWDFAILNSSGQGGETYCFRAAESDGNLFDIYSSSTYAQLVVGNLAPSVSNLTLNGASDIALTEGTTTLIHATGTVDDQNGFTDISSVNAVFYRTGVTSTASCVANDNNCYIIPTSSCSLSSCAGTSCTADCTAKIWFHADPTDPGTPWASEGWAAWMKVTDASNASGTATSSEVDLLTLLGLSVTPSISYGSLSPGSTTDPLANLVNVSSTGNASMDLVIYGGSMTAGANSIPIVQQHFATSVVGYASSSAHAATSSPGETIDVDIKKTVSSSTLATSSLRWGIRVPSPQPTGNYTGQNVFLGAVNALPWP